MNKSDSPFPERPSTFDEKGRHLSPEPSTIKGVLRNYRNIFYSILLLVFLLLPWTKINGTQTLLIDIANRKFAVFGFSFWGHDMPLIFFILATATMGLAFITSIWGRVWCGWACPQTVFIDLVFRKIEFLIEGPHLKRIKLNKSSMNLQKLTKKTVKWILYFIAGSVISHSFIAYFVGSENISSMIFQNPNNNWTTFLFTTIITIIITFNFGWFREQFCIIMCPYGRFQSVLMDGNSLAVLYDSSRGEPRRSSDIEKSKQGDCIDCNKCVTACPTGIDIRQGIQLECIACTACIDTCDEVMKKIKKPTGLIRYSTENNISATTSEVKSIWRPRTFLYGAILILVWLGLTYKLINRKPIDITFIRAIATPYQLDKEDVINHFKVHIKNQSFSKYKVSLKLNDSNNFHLISPTYPLDASSGKDIKNHIFIKFPKQLVLNKKTANIKTSITVTLEKTGTVGEKIIITKDLSLVGPFK